MNGHLKWIFLQQGVDVRIWVNKDVFGLFIRTEMGMEAKINPKSPEEDPDRRPEHLAW